MRSDTEGCLGLFFGGSQNGPLAMPGTVTIFGLISLWILLLGTNTGTALLGEFLGELLFEWNGVEGTYLPFSSCSAVHRLL